MSYDFIVSTGVFCQSSHQIRRITKSTVTSIFDWVLTPHDALIDCLNTNFANFFTRDCLTLTEDRLGVLNTRLGLIFFHDFTQNDDGTIDQETLEREYLKHKKKYDFLVDLWNERLSEARTLVVRQDDTPAAHVMALREALSRRYPSARNDLLVVRSRSAPLELSLPGVFVRYVGDPPQGDAAWMGDDASWSAVFASIGVQPS